MKPDEIKRKLDAATKAAIPAAIKDQARWAAQDIVRDAASGMPDDDGDSGEYPAVSAADVERPSVTIPREMSASNFPVNHVKRINSAPGLTRASAAPQNFRKA